MIDCPLSGKEDEMSIRTDIIALLNSRILESINFNIGGKVMVKGTDYRTIATCIQNGHVQIVYTAVNVGDICFYNHAYNCIVVGSGWRENTAVHEATHATNDWHKRVMTVQDDESAAYIGNPCICSCLTPWDGFKPGTTRI
jgi:hypothetical protein